MACVPLLPVASPASSGILILPLRKSRVSSPTIMRGSLHADKWGGIDEDPLRFVTILSLNDAIRRDWPVALAKDTDRQRWRCHPTQFHRVRLHHARLHHAHLHHHDTAPPEGLQ